MAVFGHIWPYLPIGGPSYLKLVGHCLNKVEHCIPYLGGGMDPFGHIENCPVGEGKAAMAKYGQIWLYLAIWPSHHMRQIWASGVSLERAIKM